jgi:hypothetical protein
MRNRVVAPPITAPQITSKPVQSAPLILERLALT